MKKYLAFIGLVLLAGCAEKKVLKTPELPTTAQTTTVATTTQTTQATQKTVDGTQRIGNKTHGFTSVPISWVKFEDVNVKDHSLLTQYSDTSGDLIVTMTQQNDASQKNYLGADAYDKLKAEKNYDTTTMGAYIIKQQMNKIFGTENAKGGRIPLDTDDVKALATKMDKLYQVDGYVKGKKAMRTYVIGAKDGRVYVLTVEGTDTKKVVELVTSMLFAFDQEK